MKSSQLVLVLLAFGSLAHERAGAQSPLLTEMGKHSLPAGRGEQRILQHADIDGDGN